MNRIRRHVFLSFGSTNQMRTFSKTPFNCTKDNVKEGDVSKNIQKGSAQRLDDEKLWHNESDIKTTKKINVGVIGGGSTAFYTVLLLKQCDFIKHVHLLDPKDTLQCMVKDANQIDTSTKLKHFKKLYAKEALTNMDIIALMDEDCNIRNTNPRAQFSRCSDYIRWMVNQIIRFSPTALLAIFARPVTATVPMVSEIYKSFGCWVPDKVIGSTSLECMLTEAKTARLLDLDPSFLSVPMAGGADAGTIVPLLSCARPVNYFTRVGTSIKIQD